MPWARSRSSWMVSFTGVAERVEHLGRLGVVGEDVLGEPEVHRERDEVLLGAVVEVALDLAALGVAGGDDAGPRGAEVFVGAASGSRGSPAGPSRAARCGARAHLAGELGEDAVVLLGEVVAVGGPLDHEEAEQLAGVRRRRDPQLRRRAVLEEGRQPHLEPRVAGDAGAGDDGLLLGGRGAAAARCGRAPTRPAPGRSGVPVQISARRSTSTLRSDSASWSSSSSIGIDRLRRLPHVRSTSSGGWRSP